MGQYAYGDPDRDYAGYGSASFEQTVTFAGRPGEGYLVLYARAQFHWNGEVSLNLPYTQYWALLPDYVPGPEEIRFNPITFGVPILLSGSVWAGTSGGPDGDGADAHAELTICGMRVFAADKQSILGEWGGLCEIGSDLPALQLTADPTYTLLALPPASSDIPEPATFVATGMALLFLGCMRGNTGGIVRCPKL
jgi:hypothetical protein